MLPCNIESAKVRVVLSAIQGRRLAGSDGWKYQAKLLIGLLNCNYC
jgi:hypothetical protein